jgi:hypothetical protein
MNSMLTVTNKMMHAILLTDLSSDNSSEESSDNNTGRGSMYEETSNIYYLSSSEVDPNENFE